MRIDRFRLRRPVLYPSEHVGGHGGSQDSIHPERDGTRTAGRDAQRLSQSWRGPDAGPRCEARKTWHARPPVLPGFRESTTHASFEHVGSAQAQLQYGDRCSCRREAGIGRLAWPARSRALPGAFWRRTATSSSNRPVDYRFSIVPAALHGVHRPFLRPFLPRREAPRTVLVTTSTPPRRRNSTLAICRRAPSSRTSKSTA
jgi:hypothetical protein